MIIVQLLVNDTVLELGNQLLWPTKGRSWQLVMSTNEPIYGGTAAAQFDGDKVVLTGPELIVFREQGEQDR